MICSTLAIIIGPMSSAIGTLRESSLHAALKAHYALPGDQIEAQVGGYWVDIVRGEQLIEIQTANFAAFKRKLMEMLDSYSVRVVYPIAVEKYIVRVTKAGGIETQISRRKSPRRGRAVDVFAELVRIPQLACSPRFSLELAFIREEEVWFDDGKGSWRRKGVSIADRRLVDVRHTQLFASPQDYLALLPPGLSQPFTVKQLAAEIGGPRWLAGRMAYSLRVMGLLDLVGRKGNALVYAC